MLVFASFYMLKVFMFKMKYTAVHLMIVFSIVAMAFTFESHLDSDLKNNAPLYFTALPVGLVLISVALKNSLDVHREQDECMRIFHGYKTTYRKVVTHIELVLTLVFCGTSMFLLYCLEQDHHIVKEDIIIVDYNLAAAFLFSILTMRWAGQTILDLIFYQF